jgi:hypothetical protein
MMNMPTIRWVWLINPVGPADLHLDSLQVGRHDDDEGTDVVPNVLQHRALARVRILTLMIISPEPA